MTENKNVLPLSTEPAIGGTRLVFIRDLILPALIGVHLHEQDGRQRVRINLDMEVTEDGPVDTDRLAEVVNYEEVVESVRALVAGGHINLVETLAEKIAGLCLSDKRVRSVRVRVEKLDVFADAASVGVEIKRNNPY